MFPADDASKMYTTLYDNEDPQQQEDFLLQQQRQYQESHQFIQALLGQPASPWDEVSPPSPASSCFSSSSSNSSHSSPVTGFKTMDSEEADELADLFNITIDDLLLGTPLSFSADMSLFASQQQFNQQQSMLTEAAHIAYMQTTEAQQRYFQAQQHQQQQQHYHDHSPSTPCSPCSSHHPMSPMSPTPSTSFSASSPPFTNAVSIMPHPSATAVHAPVDGITVVKNEDGSIMVLNPSADTVTFRCELCPTESFGRIHDLKRHNISKHQQTTWPCEFCQRPFVRRDALLRHYTVKATRSDGIHPPTSDTETLLAVRARAKLIG
ncbi:hypothetical protein EC957_002677 [Mortierella hygrophila]|uniref:C2H2-type domain-containing protein n=1 Tax=Mortierella hygrophila TaxID=979708 RepID=A0A9P6F4H8_9FUNG|nr:hypothetical protein EC957_002677 [Mortierella hygrophila]